MKNHNLCKDVQAFQLDRKVIELLIVNDRAIHRCGLRKLFDEESDIHVTDPIGSGQEVLAKLRARQVDVLVIDMSTEVRRGLALMESIRVEFPRLAILVLSISAEERDARMALRAGASGYISRDIESVELIQAVRQVAAGKQYVAIHGAQDTAERLDGMDGAVLHERLSARERQIMLLIIKGMSLTDIGEKLFLSVKTVSTHRRRILTKLRISSNAELVLYAVRNGILR